MITVHSKDWTLKTSTPARKTERRGVGDTSAFPEQFLAGDCSVAEEFVAESKPSAYRTATVTALDFSWEAGPGERAILALRHPSGALTFHVATASSYRGASSTSASTLRFTVPVRLLEADTERRGIVSKLIKGFIIKITRGAVDALAGWVLPKLALKFEKAAWKKKKLSEGWHALSREALQARCLPARKPASTERSLLFIHGTFSDAVSAYHKLAGSDFFERVTPLYGNRIFAYNHFTLSRTPEENARKLLEDLPGKAFSFDVITHSRGGLVLRNLVERSSEFGALARRFRLGRAVLVASPNEGTPLATPARWQDTIGWVANLLELFPDNPFTTGAELVANALVWLAKHITGDLPGLHSMDANGPLIATLQSPPGPPLDAYSALVSNYHPEGKILSRMADIGVDQFFGTANDLVVPSEGGWRIDGSNARYLPAGRIGCFGPGGNLRPTAVTHVNFFGQAETADFLVNALLGAAQPLPPIDPTCPLPDRRFSRGAQGVAPEAAARSAAGIAPIAAPGSGEGLLETTIIGPDEPFHIMILPRHDEDKRHSQILATYGSARVLEDFYLGGTEDNAGKRWYQIIRNDERIKKYVDTGSGSMPDEKSLREFGKTLFETLFPGRVRRLYDTARSLQGDQRLDLIFTSEIPWVAGKPWEFAYDPVRKTFLATEEIHFIRNVMTAIPAKRIDDRSGTLRILVASAQPVRMGQLSIEEEQAVIRRGFEPLCEAGLVEVEVLPRATPASLHGYISTGRFSVVHFIGHGEYNAQEEKGYLIFQDAQGNPYPVDERSMREILCQRNVRMVFLNACETGKGGLSDYNSGVAPALVAGGIPVVLANQYKVLDASATFFAQHFYWSIAQGMSVGEAAREARIAVNYSMAGETIDWAVPVVYARDPNTRLCERREIDQRRRPSPVFRPSTRRGIREHAVRVSVWDANYQFPRLETTLGRINAAQQQFGFEMVDLSVPIDSWHLYQKTKYLDADRFAERLRPQIAQLGSDYLCVIVDEWMACDIQDDPYYNIYGWWPTKDKAPVFILSTKDLGFEPGKPETERGLANTVVDGIAGYLTDSAIHSRGSRTCPCYENAERDAEVIFGKQKFCAACLKRLRAFPAELKALNAILKAFE